MQFLKDMKKIKVSKKMTVLLSVSAVVILIALLVLIILLSTKSSATNAVGSQQDRTIKIEAQSISTSTASSSTTNIDPIETTTETDTTRTKVNAAKKSNFIEMEKLLGIDKAYSPGNWHNSSKCARSRSIGFQLTVRNDRLVMIRLYCPDEQVVESPPRQKQPNDKLKMSGNCPINEHLIGFRIRQNKSGDTVDCLEMKCSGHPTYARLRANGSNDDNDGRQWSDWKTCPDGYRIVGLQTQTDLTGNENTDSIVSNVNFVCRLPNQDEYVLENNPTPNPNLGEWDSSFPECPDDTLAIGFELVHAACTEKCDHTGLHQIRLVCRDGSFIQSPQVYDKKKLWPKNYFENWPKNIPHPEAPDTNYATLQCEPGEYLTGFRYRMDNPVHLDSAESGKDYRGATNIDMRCSDGKVLEGYATNWVNFLTANNVQWMNRMTNDDENYAPSSFGFTYCSLASTFTAAAGFTALFTAEFLLPCDKGLVLNMNGLKFAMDNVATSARWGEWQEWKYCAKGFGISGLQGQSGLKRKDSVGLLNVKFKCKYNKNVETKWKFIGNEKNYNIGNWSPIKKCPTGEYAIGFQLTYPTGSFAKNNIGLNQINLICEKGVVIQSHFTPELIGETMSRIKCPESAYLVGFQLKTMKAKRNISGVTDIKMKCSDGTFVRDTNLTSINTSGDWGLLTLCDPQHGIVGLQAQSGTSNEPIESKWLNHNSGFTNFNVACAKKSEEKNGQVANYISDYASLYWSTAWDTLRKCPDGDFAIGFQLIIQDPCVVGPECDNTGLNQIRLLCQRGSIIQSPDLSPIYPIFGSPKKVYMCENNSYIIGFQLKSSTINKNDTFSHTDVRMKCSDNKLIGADTSSIDKNWNKTLKECDKGFGITGILAALDYSDKVVNKITDQTDAYGLSALIGECSAPQQQEKPVKYIKSAIESIDVGNWDSVRTCRNRTFAVGMQLLLDECAEDADCDHTGLNQIKLICEDGEEIKSPHGSPLYGSKYSQSVYCKNGNYFVGFRLRTETKGKKQRSGAIDIDMYCGNKNSNYSDSEGIKYCPVGYGIVGLQAQLFNSYANTKGNDDDMGLTNVNFVCAPHAHNKTDWTALTKERHEPSRLIEEEKLLATGNTYLPGAWYNSSKCANGRSFGFQLSRKHNRVIMITLNCRGNETVESPTRKIMGAERVRYEWTNCQNDEYLIGFRLRRKKFNDTAGVTLASNLDMKCSGDYQYSQLNGSSRDDNGEWTDWKTCPDGYSIDGLQTQIGLTDTDKASMGIINVNFICRLPNQDAYVIENDRFMKAHKIETDIYRPNTDFGVWDDSYRECPDNALAVGFQLVYSVLRPTQMKITHYDQINTGSGLMLKVGHSAINQIILICNGSSFIQSPKNTPKLQLWLDKDGDPPNYSTFQCKPGEYIIGFRHRKDHGSNQALFSTTTDSAISSFFYLQRFNYSEYAFPNKGTTDIHMMCSDGEILEGDGLAWYKPVDYTEFEKNMVVWGEWQNWKYCAKTYGISGVRGQFDRQSGLVNIKFKCKKFEEISATSDVYYIGNEKSYNIGLWDSVSKCPSGEFAVGFQLIVEKCQECDETGINQVRLICKGNSILQSPMGPVSFGEAQKQFKCSGQNYLAGFRVKVDKYARNQDFSGANNLEMKCSDGSVLVGDGNSYSRKQTKLDWQEWILCKDGYGIVGLQSQSDNFYQDHGHMNIRNQSDNSGITNLNMACARQSSNFGFFSR